MDFDENGHEVDHGDENESASEAAARAILEENVIDAPPQHGPAEQKERNKDGDAAQVGGEIQGLQLTNQGNVASLDVPDKWKLEPEKGPYETRGTSTAFNPADDRDARLVVNLANPTVDSKLDAAFKKITSEPPHKLTADERALVAPMLGPLGDPAIFDLKASTADLNGKTVLAVEGKFKTADRSYKGFITLTDKGEVQNIFFSAPAKQFEQHKATANLAFGSIEWRGAPLPASQRATGDAK